VAVAAVGQADILFDKEEEVKEYNKYLHTCIHVSRSECRTKLQYNDR
jgi:hypothetical protein